MYHDLINFPIRHKNLQWTASEALLDIKGEPHLFTMLKLTGTKFPLSAQIEQVWIGKVHAQHILFGEDGLVVKAYFDRLPSEGDIYFGRVGHAELDFGKFEPSKVMKLDRGKLPKNVVIRHHVE